MHFHRLQNVAILASFRTENITIKRGIAKMLCIIKFARHSIIKQTDTKKLNAI